MTPVNPPHSSIDGTREPRRRAPQRTRQVAEWVSFGISAAVVGALAAYLVYDGLRSDRSVIPVEVRVALDKSAVADGQHVLPIVVHNRGRRTLRDVKVEVTQRRPGVAGRTGGTEERSHDYDIDYLPEGTRETIYLYLDGPPGPADVRARAVQYRLE